MKPDALLLASGLMADVDLPESATSIMENTAYWMLKTGVRLSLSDHEALSAPSRAAFRAAQGRIEDERADRCAARLKAILADVQASLEGDVAQAAADALAGVNP